MKLERSHALARMSLFYGEKINLSGVIGDQSRQENTCFDTSEKRSC